MPETATTETPTNGRRGLGRPKRSESSVLHKKIIQCTKNGTHPSQREVAEIVGCSKTTVVEVLAKYGIRHNEVEEFKTNRADILAGKTQELIQALDADKIKTMPGRDLLVGIGILTDKERLERGQSTANVASLHSIADRAIRSVKPTTADVTPPDVPQRHDNVAPE